MTKSVTTKSTEPESKDAPDVTVDKRSWAGADCPKCGKPYKSQAAYDKHIKSCKGAKVKVERVPMTDDERAAKRKQYVQAWVDKNVTIQIRLLKGSDEMDFVDARVAELREQNPEAKKIGWATYFGNLLAADMKRHAKKAAKAAKSA